MRHLASMCLEAQQMFAISIRCMTIGMLQRLRNLYNIVINFAATDAATQGTRQSTNILLTQCSCNIPVSETK